MLGIILLHLNSSLGQIAVYMLAPVSLGTIKSVTCEHRTQNSHLSRHPFHKTVLLKVHSQGKVNFK